MSTVGRRTGPWPTMSAHRDRQGAAETTTWQQARLVARTVAKPLEHLDVDLTDALGAALAVPLRSTTPQPICDIAAMDGYAVAGDGPWTVVGQVLAGDPPPTAELAPGHALAIATGAPLPPGACVVLPVELTARDGRTVTGEPGEKRHIRRLGEDFAAERELLPEGSVVTPAVLGLAAGTGHDTLRVHRRPRVRVAVTGNELLRHGPPRAGRVRDAIGPMLPGLIGACGGELADTVHLTDSPDALVEALESDDVDVVAVCGATSVGPADHLRAVLRRATADILVDGVACRPGHPQLLATLSDGRLVVGLPGNPYAALVAALTLLAPALGALAGRAVPPVTTALLDEPPRAHPWDTTLIACARRGAEVVRVGHDRPGSLWAPAAADVLAVVPPGWTRRDVEVLSL